MKKKNRFGDDWQKYLDALKDNKDPVSAAEEAGLEYDDIYRRRQDDILFAEAEIIAEEQGSFVYERNMKSMAAGGDVRAVTYMAKERQALNWRNRAVSDGPQVTNDDRIGAIMGLVDQFNQREELYGEEIEAE